MDVFLPGGGGEMNAEPVYLIGYMPRLTPEPWPGAQQLHVGFSQECEPRAGLKWKEAGTAGPPFARTAL